MWLILSPHLRIKSFTNKPRDVNAKLGFFSINIALQGSWVSWANFGMIHSRWITNFNFWSNMYGLKICICWNWITIIFLVHLAIKPKIIFKDKYSVRLKLTKLISTTLEDLPKIYPACAYIGINTHGDKYMYTCRLMTTTATNTTSWILWKGLFTLKVELY